MEEECRTTRWVNIKLRGDFLSRGRGADSFGSSFCSLSYVGLGG